MMTTTLRLFIAAALCLTTGACVSGQNDRTTSPIKGKILVLEHTTQSMEFRFPVSEQVCRKKRSLRFDDKLTEHDRVYPVASTEISYNYTPGTREFYEESRVTHPTLPVRDGYGYSRWRLDFATADTGTATLIDKHPFCLRKYRIGAGVPFHLKPCPQFIMQGDEAKKNEAWLKELLYEHLNSIPSLKEENKVRLHQWDSMFLVVEFIPMQESTPAHFLVFTTSPWGTHHLSCILQLPSAQQDKLKADLTRDNRLKINHRSNDYVLPLYPMKTHSSSGDIPAWRINRGKAEKISSVQ